MDSIVAIPVKLSKKTNLARQGGRAIFPLCAKPLGQVGRGERSWRCARLCFSGLCHTNAQQNRSCGRMEPADGFEPGSRIGEAIVAVS